MKKKYIVNLMVGENIDDIFLLLSKQINLKKDGSYFVTMRFKDKTGEINAVMWDKIDNFTLNELDSGDYICVKGLVSKYRDMLQLIVKNIKLVNVKVDLSDFLPKTKKDIELMFNQIKDIANKIKNKYIKELIMLFWEDSIFVEKFKNAPAAKYIHHAYIGGLLEHTLSMALIGKYLSKHYNSINDDLLISGIILHDIGKIEELSYKTMIDYTDKGRLLSHIVIGVILLDKKIKKIKNFPKEIDNLLKHFIVSHHGSREFGSPEVPKTLEAILINSIDDMDFKINTVREYIKKDNSKKSWTFYNNIMNRYFYKYFLN